MGTFSGYTLFDGRDFGLNVHRNFMRFIRGGGRAGRCVCV